MRRGARAGSKLRSYVAHELMANVRDADAASVMGVSRRVDFHTRKRRDSRKHNGRGDNITVEGGQKKSEFRLCYECY